ncbi:MAG TPA: GNAT family N-acetyltransferase [Patescibacteria group bacterium]|nr:GNAT family N-acetyltransferase [Patescibacteria group bacterium]
MKTIVRKYKKEDRKVLATCLTKLCDHLVPLDPYKRARRLPQFEKEYTDNLLKKVKKQRGAIFVAENGKGVIGCIAGIIEKQRKEELLEYPRIKKARVLELFVENEYRGEGIGSKLMKTIEKYFKKKGCFSCRVEVFVPNRNAHRFYKKSGYQNSDIDMIKRL